MPGDGSGGGVRAGGATGGGRDATGGRSAAVLLLSPPLPPSPPPLPPPSVPAGPAPVGRVAAQGNTAAGVEEGTGAGADTRRARRGVAGGEAGMDVVAIFASGEGRADKVSDA